MNQPLVSIIIPTFNRESLISETLVSVLEQTYTSWECIIVDDGSTDKTEAVVNDFNSKDKRIRFYKRPQNLPKGANACRNYGLQLSTGKYINWFDSDDIMHPQKLALQVKELEQNSNFPFCVCQTVFFRDTIQNCINKKPRKLISNNVFLDYVKQDVMWLTQAPLWRKEFLEINNYLFDEELQAAQEWEFHSRILFHHKNYAVIEQPNLVYLRLHENSITTDKNSTSKREWNYIVARTKIYKTFKKQFSKSELNYFRKYLTYSYFNLRKMNLFAESKWLRNNFILNDVNNTFVYIKSLIIEKLYLPIISKNRKT